MSKELIQRINVGDAKRCTSATLAYFYNESVWNHFVNLGKNDNSEESKVSNVLEMSITINPDCEMIIRIELDYHNFRIINSMLSFRTYLQSPQSLFDTTPLYTLNAIRDLSSSDLVEKYNSLDQDEAIMSGLEKTDPSKEFDDAIKCVKQLHKTLVGLIYPYEPTTDVRSHLAKQIFAFNAPEYQTAQETFADDDTIPAIQLEVFDNVGSIFNEYSLEDIFSAIDFIVKDVNEKSSYDMLIGSIIKAATKNTHTKEIVQYLLNALAKKSNPRAPDVYLFDAIAKSFFYTTVFSVESDALKDVFITNIQLLYEMQCRFDSCDYRNSIEYFDTGRLYRTALKNNQNDLVEPMYKGNIRYHQETRSITLSQEQREYFMSNFDVTAMLVKRAKSITNLPSTLIYLAGGVTPLSSYFDKTESHSFVWLVEASKELHDIDVMNTISQLPEWQAQIVVEALC
ncbi:MAG: hypothetical protein CMN72_15945 [Sphingomonas sp.]|nr:hypothetical protein [Sphingomonas sp.]|tara:strand:- start:4304 stop:5668 length:1365 start_codon:yes stop_codon:yes gene_type:complete